MKVSVIIPTYNRKELLKKCLQSLINQSYPSENYEIIVVDDGSRDETIDFLEKKTKEISNLKYFRTKRKGSYAARNLGIKKASGEIIFFTDDDCVAPKDWIKKIIQAYDENPELAGVGGYLEPDEKIIETNLFAKYESYVMRSICLSKAEGKYVGGFECPTGGTANISYKKNVLEKVARFDENFFRGGDADLKLRICLKNHQLAYLPIKVTHFRKYGLKGFIQRNFERGIGELLFVRKWKMLSENKKKEYGASPSPILPVKMLKELKIDMLILFGLETLSKWLGKLSK